MFVESRLDSHFKLEFIFACTGSVEFRRGGNRPFVKQPPIPGAACMPPVAVGMPEGPVGPARRPARAPQSMYVPPAQRK